MNSVADKPEQRHHRVEDRDALLALQEVVGLDRDDAGDRRRARRIPARRARRRSARPPAERREARWDAGPALPCACDGSCDRHQIGRRRPQPITGNRPERGANAGLAIVRRILAQGLTCAVRASSELPRFPIRVLAPPVLTVIHQISRSQQPPDRYVTSARPASQPRQPHRRASTSRAASRCSPWRSITSPGTSNSSAMSTRA